MWYRNPKGKTDSEPGSKAALIKNPLVEIPVNTERQLQPVRVKNENRSRIRP
jgi:hypothetical protein